MSTLTKDVTLPIAQFFTEKECIPPNKEEVQDMFPDLKVSKCDCCTFSIESNETEIAVHVDFKKNRMIKIAVFPEDLKKKSVVIPTEVVDSHDFFLELVEDIRTCVFLGIDKTTYIKNWKLFPATKKPQSTLRLFLFVNTFKFVYINKKCQLCVKKIF